MRCHTNQHKLSGTKKYALNTTQDLLEGPVAPNMPRSRSSNVVHSYSHVMFHSSIIITCCIMNYNYIHNSGHVCHTHIKCYANGKIYRLFLKKTQRLAFTSALTQYGDYSRAATIQSAVFIQGNMVSVVEPSLVSKREL